MLVSSSVAKHVFFRSSFMFWPNIQRLQPKYIVDGRHVEFVHSVLGSCLPQIDYSVPSHFENRTRAHAHTTFKTVDGVEHQGRYTDDWQRRNGKWLCVAANVIAEGL